MRARTSNWKGKKGEMRQKIAFQNLSPALISVWKESRGFHHLIPFDDLPKVQKSWCIITKQSVLSSYFRTKAVLKCLLHLFRFFFLDHSKWAFSTFASRTHPPNRPDSAEILGNKLRLWSRQDNVDLASSSYLAGEGRSNFIKASNYKWTSKGFLCDIELDKTAMRLGGDDEKWDGKLLSVLVTNSNNLLLLDPTLEAWTFEIRFMEGHACYFHLFFF